MSSEPLNGAGAGASSEDDDWFDEEAALGERELLVGWIEHSNTGPDELTIFPADAPDADRIVTWVTAREGSYVDLGQMQ